MKLDIKKGVVLATILGVTSIGGTVFAASQYSNGLEMTAGVTNQTQEAVLEIKETQNKSFREIAKDAGKLEEFESEKLEMKKDKLEKQVQEGKITQEEADLRLEKSKKRHEKCGHKEERSSEKTKSKTVSE